MNLWTLPGPARFLLRVERALRDGANVVVRFPVATPSGFGERMRALLTESWRCTVFRPEAASPPFQSLRERFAPHLPHEWNPTLLDLCEQEDFRGRLIWLDGVGRMDREDCFAWKKLLADYAQASRSVPEFERTLFVAVLEGAPPTDAPPQDIALKCFDWRGVIDETDLFLAAHERLHSRDAGPVMRSLLATTVARVASWDPDTAERLLDEGCEAILDPLSLLQSVAREKGWTSDTNACWELGTRHGAAFGFRSRRSTGRAANEPVAKRTRSLETLVSERRTITRRPVGTWLGSRGRRHPHQGGARLLAGRRQCGAGRRSPSAAGPPPPTTLIRHRAGTRVHFRSDRALSSSASMNSMPRRPSSTVGKSTASGSGLTPARRARMVSAALR